MITYSTTFYRELHDVDLSRYIERDCQLLAFVLHERYGYLVKLLATCDENYTRLGQNYIHVMVLGSSADGHRTVHADVKGMYPHDQVLSILDDWDDIITTCIKDDEAFDASIYDATDQDLASFCSDLTNIDQDRYTEILRIADLMHDEIQAFLA